MLNSIYLNPYRNKKLCIAAAFISPHLRRRVFNLCETQYFKYSFAEIRTLRISFIFGLSQSFCVTCETNCYDRPYSRTKVVFLSQRVTLMSVMFPRGWRCLSAQDKDPGINGSSLNAVSSESYLFVLVQHPPLFRWISMVSESIHAPSWKSRKLGEGNRPKWRR